jgi:hypothetical protein
MAQARLPEGALVGVRYGPGSRTQENKPWAVNWRPPNDHERDWLVPQTTFAGRDELRASPSQRASRNQLS